MHARWKVFLLLFCSFAVELLARQKRKKKDPHQSLWSFFKTIGIVYLLIFLPMLAYFVYTLAKDPKTPDVLRGLARWLKKKLSSKLFQEDTKKRKKKKKKGSKKRKKEKIKELDGVESNLYNDSREKYA